MPYDVRIIAALNEEPHLCIQQNRLREDLYYRINVIALNIPALRERLEDVELLVPHFIQQYNLRFQKEVTHVEDDVYQLFRAYHWPGNVRELQHTIEAAMNVIEGTTLKKEHLPQHLLHRAEQASGHSEESDLPPLRQALALTEERLIKQALEKTDGNIQKAAKLLAIPRQTLQYKLSKLKQAKG